MLTETKQTCEELIADRMAGRFDAVSPDFDNMSLVEIQEFCAEWQTEPPEGITYVVGEAYHTELLPEWLTQDYLDTHELSEDDLAELEEAEMDDDDKVELWTELARELHRDHAHEMMLSVEYFKTVKVLFSTGGPEDYLEIQDDDTGIIGGRYFYKDWFDAANRYVEPDKVEELVDAMGIYLEGLH